MHLSKMGSVVAASLALLSCSDRSFFGRAPLSKTKPRVAFALELGEHVPDAAEAQTVGPLEERIGRNTRAFARLTRCDDDALVFKDEERTGADRMMTARLRAALERLAPLVTEQWADERLRVTEAWDEKGEHGPNSIHYEGRAADLTVSDRDSRKLGRLARLAVEAGFDWVFYEDASHVHVSVRR